MPERHYSKRFKFPKSKKRFVRPRKYKLMPVKLRDSARMANCQMCFRFFITMKVVKVDGLGITLTKDKIAKQEIHHVLPVRWALNNRLNPHQRENLISLCGTCHRKCLSIETKLFSADVLGLVQGYNEINFPLRILKRSLDHYKLYCSALEEGGYLHEYV